MPALPLFDGDAQDGAQVRNDDIFGRQAEGNASAFRSTLGVADHDGRDAGLAELTLPFSHFTYRTGLAP
jgi:hypothetical protein